MNSVDQHFSLTTFPRSDSTGSVTIDLEDFIIQLHNRTKSSILNKAIVVHQDEDDLGRGQYSDSLTTG